MTVSSQTLESQCQQTAFPMVVPNQPVGYMAVWVSDEAYQGMLMTGFQTSPEATSQRFFLQMPADGAYQAEVQPHQQTCYGQLPQELQQQSLPAYQQLEPHQQELLQQSLPTYQLLEPQQLHMHQQQQQELQQQSSHMHQQQLDQQQHQQVSQHLSMSKQSLLTPASGPTPHGPLAPGRLSPETQRAWSDGSASEAAENAPQQTRLSISAARRMRRRRAAERAAAALTDALSSSQDATDFQTTTQWSQSQSLSPARCQELKGWLQEGNQNHATVLNEIRGSVWPLSQDASGCLLVQGGIEHCNISEAVSLVQELQGHVIDAMRSPHANYVVQKAVEKLPMARVRFIPEELLGNASKIAKHRYGCRILCRLSEHGADDETTQQLLNEVLGNAELLTHSFGHHVVQSIMEHGSVRHKEQIAAWILQDPLGYAKDRNSSYLVEKALDQEVQCLLVAQLGDPDTIADLALSQYGCFVAKTLLQRPDLEKQKALSLIQSRRDTVACTKIGRQLLEEHGLGGFLDESTDAESA
eukprot:TRINITY_DN36726_c0_g1_i1.p1 TRINITY_DN36726_c0_g1~~TRINITY_DN36726_c0_g1_i1.p1  ORF type:complete len:527 (-),score=110.05 TRINITY_DN36726_c0_g1_i1:623-2203(-)